MSDLYLEIPNHQWLMADLSEASRRELLQNKWEFDELLLLNQINCYKTRRKMCRGETTAWKDKVIHITIYVYNYLLSTKTDLLAKV